MAKKHRMPIESGCPDGFQYMHPTMLRNFGQWKYHTHPRVGVLCHIAASGEEIWTVRGGHPAHPRRLHPAQALRDR